MPSPAARSVFSTLPRLAAALAVAAALLAPPTAFAVTIDWVTVGTPGNAANTRPATDTCGGFDNSPCGAVAYAYNFGKYEVTNAQYAEFLNKVAATDTNALYNANMWSDSTYGGIGQGGNSGSYSYFAKAGFASKPVTYVSFWDAARFSNWLQNGQPTGLQTSLTTEDGAYTLTPATVAANSVLRNIGASVFVPSENEWHKAAYYDPIAALYYDFPTGANGTIGCVAPGADTGNSANCAWAAGALTDAGAYALSDSPSGTFDQGGNVWEWQEQIKGYTWASKRGLRGGDFNDSAGSLWAGYWMNRPPTLESFDISFRVASIPEPSTALLVLTGLGSLALRHRRRG